MLCFTCSNVGMSELDQKSIFVSVCVRWWYLCTHSMLFSHSKCIWFVLWIQCNVCVILWPTVPVTYLWNTWQFWGDGLECHTLTQSPSPLPQVSNRHKDVSLHFENQSQAKTKQKPTRENMCECIFTRKMPPLAQNTTHAPRVSPKQLSRGFLSLFTRKRHWKQWIWC